MWEEVIEKAVNIEAKINLQPPSKIKQITSWCPKSYRPLVKKDKNDANREHRNRNKDKAKFSNPLPANSQLQTPSLHKDKCHRNYRGHLATEVIATKMAKKNKDKNKIKNLSHIKCYICKQKSHYAIKCLKKSKN